MRPIQGGGEGAGFNAPRQISQLEPKIALKISTDILLSTGNTNSVIASKSPDEDSEDEGEICAVKDDKMEVWKKELEQRLFLLYQRKKEFSGAVSRNSKSVQLNNSFENTSAEDGNVEPLVEKTYTDSAITVARERDMNLFTESLHKKQKTATNVEPSTVIKFIPGLPKNIETVVELWRRGDKDLNCHPLRFFIDPEMRKKLVPKYSHRLWTLSRQKNSFLRFKALVERVQEFGPVRMRLMIVGIDEDWEKALQGFHEMYDKGGRPQALSRILRVKE